MRPFLTLSLSAALLATLPFFPAQAEEIKAPAELKQAIVYSDRAMLSREAKIKVPAGAHTILIEGLSTALFPDSLRVEGKGTTSMVLGALSHKIVNETDLVSERERGINIALEAAQNQRAVVEAEKQSFIKQQEFLNSLQAQASEKTKEELADFKFNTEQWVAAGQTIQTGLAEAARQIIGRDTKLAEIDKMIEKLQGDISQLYTGQKSTVQVSIPVEAQAAGTLTLTLSYQLPGATWRPVYDARLDTKTGALELVQYGSVSQATGEDWEGITLTLSTAQPQRGSGLPEPQPFWVNLMEQYAGGGSSFSNIAQNIAGPAMRQAARVNKVEFALEEGAASADALAAPAAPPEVTAQITPAVIETGGFTAEYRIPALSKVPSDGTETKLFIGNFETENALEIHIRPQLSNEAYLVAKAKLKGENPVLPGSVNLFRDGAYVGQSTLPLLRAGKETTLPFGIDDQIAVSRKTLKDEKSESGMIIGTSSVIERGYSTEIQNLRGKAVKIVVMETVPAPQNEKITLEILKDKTTPGFEKDADKIKGLLRWNFDLAAQEKKDVALGWSLSWPKDSQITGLPY